MTLKNTITTISLQEIRIDIMQIACIRFLYDGDKKCAVEPQDKTDIFYVNVDGVDIKDQLARATTSFYNITSPDDPVTDIFAGTKSGTSRAIADGYFLFLQPLSKGEHLLEFSVEDDISGNKYAREGSYKVLVE